MSCSSRSSWPLQFPQHRCRCSRRRSSSAAAAQRRQRDPASYSSMEELRRELEQEGGTGWVTGLITWLSDAATTARSSATPLQAAYQQLIDRFPRSSSSSNSSIPSSAADDPDDSDLDPEAVRELQAILSCGRATVAKLVRRCPVMLQMERRELMRRLIDLKALFPEADVARMIELAPGAFLEGPWQPKAAQLAAAGALLRRELEGADLGFMFSEDPMVLFEPADSLEVGLERFRELWPGLTPTALSNSEPLHLSLAVKALGLRGPPKGF